jgi:hypothetical protein
VDLGGEGGGTSRCGRPRRGGESWGAAEGGKGEGRLEGTARDAHVVMTAPLDRGDACLCLRR